ncbi:hypothetical protein [Ottowia sp.]|uniref:type IV pilus modification PilV family protein n=1 Tax=Ottowia sp. TaxID=1898956 RepID=UPI002CCD14E0|nr:hypothetical protein [Ottowia sp.]HRN74784.1 hypothetical protein [Ottowia sp.]
MRRITRRPIRSAPSGARQGGFSILEALVTLVVVSAGLLGLAGLQSTLTREADASRHRGEATRLAQERIEAVRSFHQIASVSDPTADPPVAWSWSHFGWNDLPESRSDIIDYVDYANTQYTRTLKLGGEGTDTLRPLRVTVSWTDRAGQGQSVILSSVIAKMELAMTGGLGFTPPLGGATQIKMPKNRHLNIPFPAVDLGGNRSAYNDPAGGYSIIFSNESGSVVHQCRKEITSAGQINDTDCDEVTGYVVAGYVSRARTSIAWPSNVVVQNIGAPVNEIRTDVNCRIGSAINQNIEGTVIVDYRYYICVVPADEGESWSGWVRLAGMAGSNTLVCRYQYKSTAVTDGERNKQPYTDVELSLDNQNYRIVAADTCPSLPLVEHAAVATLEPHQNCRGSLQDSAIRVDCPAAPAPVGI